ncbi:MULTISPECIES: hypothetical protein [unclassified Thiocapsa]|uniref:hypothetical protein n=1 Tax=unclassified Thiocapsa TaxID=2641286 RepID=UPI0035B34D45
MSTAYTGMDELWRTAWALQGLTRTLDIEDHESVDTEFERDRLSGIASAAHILSARLLQIADAFNDALSGRHSRALERIAADTGETPVEAAARLLCAALDDDIAQREAAAAAERACIVAEALRARAERAA